MCICHNPTAVLADVYRSLQQNSSIRQFEIHGFRQDDGSHAKLALEPLTSFLDTGKARFTSVTLDCAIEEPEPDNDIPTGPGILVATLNRLSNLRRLELDSYLQLSYASFLLDSLRYDSRLQQLEIGIDDDNQNLWHSLVRFFRKASTIRLLTIHTEIPLPEDHLLQIAKSNFSLREIRFRDEIPERQVEQKLQYYAQRNRSMEKWIDDPTTVPVHLWSDALNVAVQAGNPSVLFRSLFALRGDLGSIRRKRKRTRTSIFTPS